MVVKADLRRRIGTLAEWEDSIQKSLDLIGCSHIRIGTEIETTILFDLARDDETRIALIGNLDEGIGLVVLEHDIVFGLVLLDEIDLQKQSLNIGLGDDKFKIHNLRYQRFRLGIVASSKIGPHPIAKILGLPHIDDGTVLIFVNVTARTRRQELELGFNQVIHTLYYSKKERSWPLCILSVFFISASTKSKIIIKWYIRHPISILYLHLPFFIAKKRDLKGSPFTSNR